MCKRILFLALAVVACVLAAGYPPAPAWGQPWTYQDEPPPRRPPPPGIPPREPPPRHEEMIFDNGNVYRVLNGPRGSTTFVLRRPYRITKITNYHWNFGHGALPGFISLRDAAGNILGRWEAASRPGQGGVPHAYWDVYPGIVLHPGKYTILDSNPATWSCNPENRFRGMSQVYGYPRR